MESDGLQMAGVCHEPLQRAERVAAVGVKVGRILILCG